MRRGLGVQRRESGSPRPKQQVVFRFNCSAFLRPVVIHRAMMQMPQQYGWRGVRVSMKDTQKHMLTPSNL